MEELSIALGMRKELAYLDVENRIWKNNLDSAHLQGVGLLREITRAYAAIDQKQQALDVFDMAIEYLESLVGYDPSRLDWRRRLAAIYDEAGLLAHEMGQIQRARALYQKALGTLGELRDQGALNEEDQEREQRMRELLRSMPSR